MRDEPPDRYGFLLRVVLSQERIESGTPHVTVRVSTEPTTGAPEPLNAVRPYRR